eukprot:5613711-Pleurochrysis_carterae.AAC.2
MSLGDCCEIDRYRGEDGCAGKPDVCTHLLDEMFYGCRHMSGLGPLVAHGSAAPNMRESSKMLMVKFEPAGARTTGKVMQRFATPHLRERELQRRRGAQAVRNH